MARLNDQDVPEYLDEDVKEELRQATGRIASAIVQEAGRDQLEAWLADSIQHTPRHVEIGVTEVPRHHRLAYLWLVNDQSMKVREFANYSQYPPGHALAGHPKGLSVPEGIQLTYFAGVMDGFHLQGVEAFKVLSPYIEQYVQSHPHTYDE